MKHYRFALFVKASLASVFLAATGPVLAQAGANDTIEEIIVTSRKLGAENLQEIPAAITALDRTVLEEMMVTDFEDFARQVPGLTFLDTSPGERKYGSVTPENASALFANENVDGALVGGASLEASSFLEICRFADQSAT